VISDVKTAIWNMTIFEKTFLILFSFHFIAFHYISLHFHYILLSIIMLFEHNMIFYWLFHFFPILFIYINAIRHFTQWTKQYRVLNILLTTFYQKYENSWFINGNAHLFSRLVSSKWNLLFEIEYFLWFLINWIITDDETFIFWSKKNRRRNFSFIWININQIYCLFLKLRSSDLSEIWFIHTKSCLYSIIYLLKQFVNCFLLFKYDYWWNYEVFTSSTRKLLSCLSRLNDCPSEKQECYVINDLRSIWFMYLIAWSTVFSVFNRIFVD
jgi:hypothetical protein